MTDKDFWFGCKHPSDKPTRRVAFDLRFVSRWEGSQRSPSDPWIYSIYFSYTDIPVRLSQEEFNSFDVHFTKFLARET